MELKQPLNEEPAPTRCPWCRDSVGGGRRWLACALCLARHHADCWREGSGCATCRRDDGLIPVRALLESRLRVLAQVGAMLFVSVGLLLAVQVRTQAPSVERVEQAVEPPASAETEPQRALARSRAVLRAAAKLSSEELPAPETLQPLQVAEELGQRHEQLMALARSAAQRPKSKSKRVTARATFQATILDSFQVKAILKQEARSKLQTVQAALAEALSQNRTLRRTYKRTRARLQRLEGQLRAPNKKGPRIEGKVIGVKTDIRPPLVLLSVGSDDGVRAGQAFSIYQGKTLAGRVIVERVLADGAGARVSFTRGGRTIRIGDRAVTRVD